MVLALIEAGADVNELTGDGISVSGCFLAEGINLDTVRVDRLLDYYTYST